MIEYLTTREAAQRLGVSPNSIGRAARTQQVGVFAGGRLVAIAPSDLERLKPALHDTPGNPIWIASAKTRKPQKRRTR
jgi:hypothetical protein